MICYRFNRQVSFFNRLLVFQTISIAAIAASSHSIEILYLECSRNAVHKATIGIGYNYAREREREREKFFQPTLFRWHSISHQVWWKTALLYDIRSLIIVLLAAFLCAIVCLNTNFFIYFFFCHHFDGWCVYFNVDLIADFEQFHLIYLIFSHWIVFFLLLLWFYLNFSALDHYTRSHLRNIAKYQGE